MTGDKDCFVDQSTGIKSLYTELAEQPDKDFGWATGKENARVLGYDARWLTALPDEIWASDAAVGNPFSLGDIQLGQTIIDLGCGAGADLCIAGLMCGEKGRAIGVDLTPAMIKKTRDNAKRLGLSHVEAIEADFAKLPLEDNIADVVISNGSINLSSIKPAVFSEVYRVLKPSGRFQFADMVKNDRVEKDQEEGDSWADCVSGTLKPDDYLEMLKQAGFKSPELKGTTSYKTSATTIGALFWATKGNI